jgi:hypothetical protein
MSPPTPDPTDWYIVFPLGGSGKPGDALNSFSSFAVHTSDMDLAAQAAFDRGYAACVVILGTYYAKAAS